MRCNIWLNYLNIGINQFHFINKIIVAFSTSITGIDISAPEGTKIKAAADGTVITVGYNTAYGNRVIISHGGGVTTLYAHMSKFGCKVGDKVSAGDVIGYVGSTGYSTGNHLHFSVLENGNTLVRGITSANKKYIAVVGVVRLPAIVFLVFERKEPRKRGKSMKRTVSLWMVVFIVILTTATTFNVTYMSIWHSFNNRLDGLSAREKTYAKLAEMQNYIDEYYITGYDEDTLIDGAAEGMADALPDQWSYYMTAEESLAYGLVDRVLEHKEPGKKA